MLNIASAIMDRNKNSSGWILCPSKSFCGKFYYFNVKSGIAVWSIHEAGDNLKKGNKIQKVFDKSHSYPEPNYSPLVDVITNTPVPRTFTYDVQDVDGSSREASSSKHYQTRDSHVFGKTLFPNYICGASSFKSQPATSVSTKINQVTQTPDCGINIWNTESTQKTLSERISENTKAHSSKMWKYGNESLTSYHTSSNFAFEIRKADEVVPKSNSKEPILARTPSPGRAVKNTGRKYPAFSTEPGLVMSENIILGRNQHLSSNDLRFVLIAKRKASAESKTMSVFEGKKNKPVERQQKPSEKHVTFNFLFDDKNGNSINDDGEMDSTPLHNVYPIAESKSKLSYVIADKCTLLDYFDFIENFVKSDSIYRLLIPQFVRSEIKNIHEGERLGRNRTIVARRIAMRLSNPPCFYASPSDVRCFENETNEFDIIQYCLNLKTVGYDLTLLTNNIIMFGKANSVHIKCKNVKDIIPHDKIQIISMNTNNIFLTPKRDFNPFRILRSNSTPDDRFTAQMENLSLRNTRTTSATDMRYCPNKSSETLIFNKQFAGALCQPTLETRKRQSSQGLEQNPITQSINFSNPTELNKYINKSSENNICSNVQGADDSSRQQTCVIQKQQSFKRTIRSHKTISKHMSDPTELNKYASVLKNNSTDLKKNAKKKLTVDERVEWFLRKDKSMENRIKHRLEELKCCFTQILEDAFTQVLLRHSIQNTPWELYNILMKVKEIYNSHEEVKFVIYKICTILLKENSRDTILKRPMEIRDFLVLCSAGTLLIKYIKNLEPNCLELGDAYRSLSKLLDSIDEEPEDFESIEPSGSHHNSYGHETTKRIIFSKSPLQIIKYLKANFDDWKDYEIPAGRYLEEELQCSDVNTYSALNQNPAVPQPNKPNTEKYSVKTSTLSAPPHANRKGENKNGKQSGDINSERNKKKDSSRGTLAKNKANRNEDNLSDSNTDSEPLVTVTLDKDFFTSNNRTKSFCMNTSSGLNETERDSSINQPLSQNNESAVTKVLSGENACSSFDVDNKSRNIGSSAYCKDSANNDEIRRNCRVKENGASSSVANTDSETNVDPLLTINTFFREISQTSLAIHKFLINSIQQLNEDSSPSERQTKLYKKVVDTQKIVSNMIKSLKRIIERESSDGSVVAMLKHAGVDVSTDIRLSKYKQVVTKCLHEIQILNDVLKSLRKMVGEILGEETNDSDSAYELTDKATYFNIFE